MLGDDLGDLLGHRIPRDHSRQVLADHYAALLGARRVMDLGCGKGDSVDLFRSVRADVDWVGVDIEDSPEVAERKRTDAEFRTFDGRRLPFDDGSFELVYCKQVDRLKAFKEDRDQDAVRKRLDDLRSACGGSTNLLEPMRAALKERCSLGEVCGVMREEFGEYSEA